MHAYATLRNFNNTHAPGFCACFPSPHAFNVCECVRVKEYSIGILFACVVTQGSSEAPRNRRGAIHDARQDMPRPARMWFIRYRNSGKSKKGRYVHRLMSRARRQTAGNAILETLTWCSIFCSLHLSDKMFDKNGSNWDFLVTSKIQKGFRFTILSEIWTISVVVVGFLVWEFNVPTFPATKHLWIVLKIVTTLLRKCDFRLTRSVFYSLRGKIIPQRIDILIGFFRPRSCLSSSFTLNIIFLSFLYFQDMKIQWVGWKIWSGELFFFFFSVFVFSDSFIQTNWVRPVNIISCNTLYTFKKKRPHCEQGVCVHTTPTL